MKRLMVVLVTAAMIGAFASNAGAANGLKKGAFALSANVNDDFVLSGRYFVAHDLAVLAMAGFGMKGGDSEGTDLGLGVGIRKYISGEDFAPFFGAVAFYKSTNDSRVRQRSIMGLFGAEYFFEKRFSIEGNVGLGYTMADDSTGRTKVEDNTFGTQRFGVSLNFYFL